MLVLVLLLLLVLLLPLLLLPLLLLLLLRVSGSQETHPPGAGEAKGARTPEPLGNLNAPPDR